MAQLRSTIEQGQGRWLRIALTGAIDETADLGSIFERLDRDTVIDLAGIERMNSIGVDRWIKAITRLSGQHRVMIEACSYPVVIQANVVSNFFGGAEVRSCMAPYFCPACQQHITTLVTREEVDTASDDSPSKSCAECGGPMEFDELESFFGFFRSEA